MGQLGLECALYLTDHKPEAAARMLAMQPDEPERYDSCIICYATFCVGAHLERS